MLPAASRSVADVHRCHFAVQEIIGSAIKTAAGRGIGCAMPVGPFADLPALPA
jgi:hypothetical protein